MDTVDVKTVQHVARLARLQVEPAEQARFAAQLAEILQYVQQLQQVPTDGVEPTSHVVPLSNVTRPDQPRPSIAPEAVLALAPARHNQLYKVPKIIE
jgi:aspartyl-tRNA(Asn)/glutamyl-tRNA(Gln) amidotransferase subunit C